MSFTPATNCELYNVPLWENSPHTFDFESIGAQRAYFSGKALHSFTNFTFARDNADLLIPLNVEAVRNINYLSYVNTNFSDKRYYAFVLSVEYESPNTTRIKFTIDVLQSYAFDYHLRTCTVLRETVNDDRKFKNLLPENVETGDIKTVEKIKIGNLLDYNGFNIKARTKAEFEQNFIICVFTANKIEGLPIMASDRFFGGALNPCIIYGCENSFALNTLIDCANNSGQAEEIVDIVAIPRQYVNIQKVDENFSNISDISDVWESRGYTKKLESISGYAPKNNKLFNYPFNYVSVISSAGSKIDFKYELFNDETSDYINFEVLFCGGTTPQLSAFVCDYDGANGICENNSVSFSNFPHIAWKYDTFANQNALNENALNYSLINTTVNGALNIAENPLQGTLNFVSNLAQMSAQRADLQKQPDRIKNRLGANMGIYSGTLLIELLYKQISAEYAKKIDDYFSKFGYFVNSLKIPTCKNRPVWDYIQTADCIVTGNFSNDIQKEICEKFNSGLTFWHNPELIYNYSVDNSAPIKD